MEKILDSILTFLFCLNAWAMILIHKQQKNHRQVLAQLRKIEEKIQN